MLLVGFMGAGKTSVGRALAARLGWSFEDLDERIEQREGRSVPQIFRDSGEDYFRRAEHFALKELLEQWTEATGRIAALGGGAFAQESNVNLIAESGIPAVFLDAPVEELWRRCSEQSAERPLRSSPKQFRALHQARIPHYAKAFLRIETSGKLVETVADEIARALHLTP